MSYHTIAISRHTTAFRVLLTWNSQAVGRKTPNSLFSMSCLCWSLRMISWCREGNGRVLSGAAGILSSRRLARWRFLSGRRIFLEDQ